MWWSRATKKCQNAVLDFLASGLAVKDKQILQAIVEMFQNAGKPLDEDAVNFALKVARDPLFPRFVAKQQQLVNACLAAGLLLRVKESSAIQSPEQLHKLLERIKKEGPFVLRPAIRATMKEVSKDLPRKPSTGRSHILTLEQKKVACGLVSGYQLAGESMRTAYQKAADQLGVGSTRTIQRAWSERRNLLGNAAVAMVPPAKPTAKGR